MQRPLSLQHSFILMFLGLSVWLGIQGLLPRATPSASSQEQRQTRLEPIKPESSKSESSKSESSKSEPAKPEFVKPEFVKPNPAHPGLSVTGTSSSRSHGHGRGSNTLFEKTLGQGGLWLSQSRWFFPSKFLHRGNLAKRSQSRPTGRVLVDLSDRKLFLYVNGDLQAEYAVAIGQAEWETPLGQYHIGEMQQQPAWEHPLTGKVVPAGPENPLGAAWIGFLAEGDYHFGIHGTLDESRMGEAVSHGCVRMRNADILALYAVVQPDWPLAVVP
ncbi:MAG: L,D-transpeptidase [Synechococcales cyanobacterium CRU_2_2]|nr:L,D-transpeptidase [Synechococcales cyanobacterium CRU_2_2]